MTLSRRLIPLEDVQPSSTTTSTTTPTTSRISCSSNVVGVIPPKIHKILTTITNNNEITTTLARGQIDNNASGISYLLHSSSNDTNNNKISVWEHSTQTLNEELVPPSRGICVTLIHPEHNVAGANNNAAVESSSSGKKSDELLVTCLGPSITHGRGRGDQGRNNSLRHLYAASPTTGVLCVWVLDYNNNKDTDTTDDVQECDASVRLVLKEGEILTSLTSMDGGCGGGSDTWLLASTNLGRLWKIYKTSRPLTLHAKLVKKKMIIDSSGSNSNKLEEEGEEGTGIVRGLYKYFTTPNKMEKTSTNNSYGGGGEDDAMDNVECEEDENIVALVPLPSAASSTDYIGSVQQQEVCGKSPPRTAMSPSPQKQRRVSSSVQGSFTDTTTSSSRVISISSSLVLKEWKVSLLAGAESEGTAATVSGKKEGFTSRIQLFPRNTIDGTLDLSSLQRHATGSGEMEEGGSCLEGYDSMEMLATPTLAKDGKSLIIVISIAKENDVEATRAYILRIGIEGGRQYSSSTTPYVMDAAWLDRYSGQSLSKIIDGGMLDCAGLVVAEEDQVEDTNVMMNGGRGGVAGSVAYVAFGPRSSTLNGGSGHVCPVTVSAVHFPSVVSVNGGQVEKQHPRVKDLDLYSTIVPSIVQNSMSYDPLTGGCILLSSSGLLCGTHIRFPIITPVETSGGERGIAAASRSLSLDEASLELLAQDETILTIKSHLQSSFRQYLSKLKEGGSGGSNPARAGVPPSIGTCPCHVLSAAVMLASKDFACASSSPGVGAGGMFSPRMTSSSPVTILRDKLKMHKDFVTFLVHAGAYRRVSTAGRVRLRDHGEMITASRALLIECQSHFSNAEAGAAGGGNGRSELAQARQMVMSAVEGASNDVVALPRRWAALQQLPNDGFLLLVSSSICEGMGQALGYRQNESISLYDIPSYDPSSAPPSPWTSSTETLKVLFTQLQAIEQSGENIFSTSDAEIANVRHYVEDLAAAALSGHRDIVQREPDNDVMLKSYDDTKRLAVPLLRRYANDNGDDLNALQTSLDAAFFEGIVQICHDHRSSWRFHGPYSDQEPDERYDLRLMMSNASADSPYAHLHESRDYRSGGLSFCSYVLRWYADRGLYHEVFELGKNCPHDLTRYVRNDSRLSNLAWVQNLRVGGHEQATLGLLSVSSPVLFGDKEGDMTLWEKDQMMSLAKLSNKLAGAKNTAAVDIERSALIENSLTLISAQRILQEDTEQGGEIALKEEDLLRLAVEKIQSSRDVDDIKRFGICGLAIAAAKPPGQNEAKSNDASSIWEALVQADRDTWESVANENKMSVGGISEEELIHRVGGTAFVQVMCDFVTSGEKMPEVGFNEHARNQISQALGSDSLAKVLSLSADTVVANAS